MSKIKLFVGLGNPGDKYLTTRHNAGFWWIDFVALNHRLSFKKSSKYFGEHSNYQDNGDIHFLKPSTFMNDSGKSVQAITKFYKIKPEEILIIHDELDIIPGYPMSYNSINEIYYAKDSTGSDFLNYYFPIILWYILFVAF